MNHDAMLAELDSLERLFDCRLPEDYREWILATNGAFFENLSPGSPPGFYFPFQVSHLYPLIAGPDVGTWTLRTELESRQENTPEYFDSRLARFSFGADPYGNPFYFHLKGPTRGHIFTWVDGFNPDEEVHLADSFASFMGSLVYRQG